MTTKIRYRHQAESDGRTPETTIKLPIEEQNRKLIELVARKNKSLESMIKEVRRMQETITNHLNSCPNKGKEMITDGRGKHVNLLMFDWHILHKAQEVYNESSIYL